jgi:hypothetical protein
MIDTYDSSANWAGDPYGLSDTPGMVATSGWSTGVMTDDGPIGTPQQSGDKAQSQSSTPKGNPLVGLVIAVAIVALVMFMVHRFGKADEDFKNIKGSLWNAFIIGLAATAIIPINKLATAGLAQTKLPFTAELNTYVQAA